MPKKFGDIDVTEILDYEGAETAKIARYERIMQHRTIEAMNGLSLRLDGIVTELNDATSNLKVVATQLNGVTQTIYRVGQLAQEKVDEAIKAAADAGKAQGRQQLAMVGLTVALVLCTGVYTWLNYSVLNEMRKGNDIQAAVAVAAKEQAAAAREANELAKHASVSEVAASQQVTRAQSTNKQRGK